MNTTIQPFKKVAVIDDFKNKTYDIDGDGVKDFSHGQLVSRLIKAENKDVLVTELEAAKEGNIVDGELESQLSMLLILRRLTELAMGKEKYDGINLSLAAHKPMSDYKKVCNNKLSPENFKNYVQKIKDFITNPKDKMGQMYNAIIGRMEELAGNDVQVYVGAGNKGKYYFNVLGLADGVKNVGAKDPKGKIADYSGQHSDIDIYEQGEFKLRPMSGENEPITNKEINIFGKLKKGVNLAGYDMNNDGKIDIDVSELSSKGKKKTAATTTIKGTSFATPAALAKNLK